MNEKEFNEKYLMNRPTKSYGESFPDYPEPLTIPRIFCEDGFNVSVQAGPTMYSSPRNGTGPWIQVELGFPSEKDDSILPWVESDDSPTETVYGYVPLNIVLDMFETHGGIDTNKTKVWNE